MIDKGYYKDIPQLAKPKGNERQGFRGEAAAASDAAAGRSAGRDTSAAGTSDRGDGPATGAQFGSDKLATEKLDFFDQSYVQGPFGIDGYRDTVVPNTTQYGNRNRLGSLIASGIGALVGVPGLGFLTNLTGPYNNRAFYDTKVVPAGKTNLDYDQYMAARMAGEIDAYGNPIGGGDQGIQSLQYLYPTMSTTSESVVEEPVQEISFYDRLRQNLGLI